jgi:hypothetical protein
MNTIVLPEVGTKVRARYIPSVTTREGKSTSMTYPDFDYTSQVVTVTLHGNIRTSSLHNEEAEYRDVMYARFTTPLGDTSEYYFTDWEVVHDAVDTTVDTTPEPELTPEQAELKGLNDRISNLLSLQRRVYGVLREVNETANEVADRQNYCSEYEDVLDKFNSIIIRDVPEWDFRFEGRLKTYNVTVERRRTVVEYCTVQVEGPAGATKYDLEDNAHEAAEDAYDWDVLDEDVDETYITDVELAD